MLIATNYCELTAVVICRVVLSCLYIFTTFCVTVSPCIADDLSIPQPLSALTTDYTIDSDGGQSVNLNANLAMGMHQHITLGWSGNFQTQVATTGEELETGAYLFGYAQDASNSLTLGLDYEQWGEEDKITMDSLRFSVGVDVQDWSVTFTPQRRDIVLTTVIDEQFELSSNGLAVDIDYFGVDPWLLSVGYLINNYSDNLVDLVRRALAGCNKNINCLKITTLSINRLQLVANSNQLSLGVSYFLTRNTLGLSWLRSESEIDASINFSTQLFISTDLPGGWSVTLSLGQQLNTDESTTEFLGGSLSYYW